MKTLIIMLIFSMAFIGFYINGNKINDVNLNLNLTNEPEKNEKRELLDYNYNYNDNDNETREKIYNEMGDLLNPDEEKFETIQVVNTTTFKGEGLPSAKPHVNASSRIVDDNGLFVDFGSYNDNFPYESSYLKKINSENKLASSNVPIIKKKGKTAVGKVILPEGIKEYVEDFSYFRRATNMSKDTIEERDKIVLVAQERVILASDKIRNVLPDEIVLKSKPDSDEFNKQRNAVLVANVDKGSLFFDTSKKIEESKMLYNLE
jgi:hypothetical protein